MTNECEVTQSWIDDFSGTLPMKAQSSQQRHVATCDECQQYWRFVQSFRDLSFAYGEASPPRPNVAKVAVDAAFAPRPSQPLPWRTMGVLSVAAAASLFLYAFVSRPGKSNDASPAALSPSKPPLLSRLTAAPPVALPWMHAAPDAETGMAMGGTQVKRVGEAHFGKPRRGVDLALEDGRVQISAPPGDARKYVVQTRFFRVEVLGARALVDSQSVVVQEGQVRIVSLAGRVLVPSLRRGQRWMLPDVAPATSPTAGYADLLAQARQKMAQGESASASALAKRILQQTLEPNVRAEVETLLAECHQIGGDLSAAARQYELVAAKYVATRAGENALFAAAKLWQSLAADEQAQSSLRLYLQRYPHGLFRADAERRLRANPE